jgi:hypothetical protein
VCLLPTSPGLGLLSYRFALAFHVGGLAHADGLEPPPPPSDASDSSHLWVIPVVVVAVVVGLLIIVLLIITRRARLNRGQPHKPHMNVHMKRMAREVGHPAS